VTQNSLEELYAEIDSKLQARLEEIELKGQNLVEKLEREQCKVFDKEYAQRQKNLTEQLNQITNKAQREALTYKQTAIWRAQQQCIEQVLLDARQILDDTAMDRPLLNTWISQARERLGHPQQLQLKLKQSWLEQWQKNKDDPLDSSLSTSSTPILGGAILEDTEQHIEVDGSWDQRLESLVPLSWQRWYQYVGKDSQD